MKKKILALCLVVALLATAIAGATLAYFTDKTEVAENTFSVGNVDIELDETDIDGEEDRDLKNEYKDMYPGYTKTKDPTVTVKAGSEASYVRMFVTVDDYSKLQEAFANEKYDAYWYGTMFLLENLVEGWDKDVWPCAGFEVKDGAAIYEFRYYTTTDEDPAADYQLDALFDSVVIPTAMTNDELAKLNGIEIDVVAEAIQAEGLTADTAWTEFANQKDKTQQK